MLKKKIFETTIHYVIRNAAASAAISAASVIASEAITYAIKKIKLKREINTAAKAKIEDTSKIVKNDDGIFDVVVEAAE